MNKKLPLIVTIPHKDGKFIVTIKSKTEAKKFLNKLHGIRKKESK